jgi:hypothetical protein
VDRVLNSVSDLAGDLVFSALSRSTSTYTKVISKVLQPFSKLELTYVAAAAVHVSASARSIWPQGLSGP